MLYPNPLLSNGAVLRLLFGAQSAPRRFLLGLVDNHPLVVSRAHIPQTRCLPKVTAGGKGEPLCVSHRFVVFPTGAGAA